MRILLSVYACAPGEGSEPGVGWNAAQTLACHHEVWALTRARNRAAVEKALARRPRQSLHFVYYDLPGWSRWWRRGGWSVQLYYYAWQIGAYVLARRLHREIGFDVVHHVTLAKYWAPSFLAFLDVPFVWGPVGGGDSIPRSFWREFGLRGIVYEAGRDLARWIAEHDFSVKLTARRSAVALASTPGTAKRLRALRAQNVQIMSQLGMPHEELSSLARRASPRAGPIRFISVGELFWWKGIRLGLRAFAQARLDESEYWIVGDGRERQDLQRLTEALGIGGRVRFWGALPRDETIRRLAESHILVFPGMRDSGGMACLEAMAMGRSIICLDLAGPSALTRGVALQIPAHCPAQVVRDLAAAMRRLARGPELRTELEEAGRRRSSDIYRSETKAEFFVALYRNVVKGVAGPSDSIPTTGLIEESYLRRSPDDVAGHSLTRRV